MQKKTLGDSAIVVFLAMIVGGLTGTFVPALRGELLLAGNLYMALLKMCALPMIILCLVSAPRRLFGEGTNQSLRPGLRMLWFFLLYMLLGSLVGIVVAIILKPGIGIGDDALAKIDRSVAGLEGYAQSGSIGTDVIGFILKVIPENIFAALSNGGILPIMFFCIMVGMALARISRESRRTIFSIIDEAEEAMGKVLDWCLKLLPIGIFCVTGGQDYSFGSPAMIMIRWLLITVFLGFVILSVIFLLLFSRYTGQGLTTSVRILCRPFFVAFSTQSSIGTLPVIMDALARQPGLDQKRVSVSATVGTPMNQPAPTMFNCVAVIFLMQLFGRELTLFSLVVILVCSVISALPGPVVVGVAALELIGIIAEPLALPHAPVVYLLVGMCPLIDAGITAVNALGNITLSVLIGKSTTEKGTAA